MEHIDQITKEKQKNAENTVPYKYLLKWSSLFYNYNNSNTNENPIENMSIVIKLQEIEKVREDLSGHVHSVPYK